MMTDTPASRRHPVTGFMLLRAVMEWAIAMKYRADNPCDRLSPVLGPQQARVRHMRALSHREVAATLAAVRASSARSDNKVRRSCFPWHWAYQLRSRQTTGRRSLLRRPAVLSLDSCHVDARP